MEFCHSYLFVTFVVMTVDQVVARDDEKQRIHMPYDNDHKSVPIYTESFSQPLCVSFYL